MEYPEEIYATRAGGLLTSNAGACWGRRHAYQVGYEAGKAGQADPLAGYSNLTAAIKAGDPIDWERLGGLKSKLVNSLGESISHQLSWNTDYDDDKRIGQWWVSGMSLAIDALLEDSVGGKDGWSLWIEGDIPMRRKTADQLEPGYFFTGVLSGTTSESLMCVAGGLRSGKHVRYAFDFMPSHHPASKWEVIEEHGPFQKPEGK